MVKDAATTGRRRWDWFTGHRANAASQEWRVHSHGRCGGGIQPIRQPTAACRRLSSDTSARRPTRKPGRGRFPKLPELPAGAAFAAHNAKFDHSSRRRNVTGCIEIHMPVIDTLEFSAGCTLSLKSHRPSRGLQIAASALKTHTEPHDARRRINAQPHARHGQRGRRASPG